MQFFLSGPTCNSHLNTETNFGKGIPGCPQTCGFTFKGNCTLPFAEGCKCKAGYLLDGNKCVKPIDCGCMTPEGDYLSVGLQASNDCNTVENHKLLYYKIFFLKINFLIQNICH